MTKETIEAIFDLSKTVDNLRREAMKTKLLESICSECGFLILEEPVIETFKARCHCGDEDRQ